MMILQFFVIKMVLISALGWPHTDMEGRVMRDKQAEGQKENNGFDCDARTGIRCEEVDVLL